MNDIAPGKPGFWVGANSELQGMVVTGFATVTSRTAWILKRASEHSLHFWIETWLEENGKLVRLIEEPIKFKARTVEKAQEKYEAHVRERHAVELQKLEGLRQQSLKGPFSEVSKQEADRVTGAWMTAHKAMWPNLLSLPQTETSQTRIQEAIKADLLTMGFDEFVSLRIAKLATKKTTRPVDKFNLWLVENWLHGDRLSAMNPRERLVCAKANGHSASEKSLGMHLTRLGLTSRQ